MNLTKHENSAGLELLMDQNTGAMYASTRGLARLVGRNESTVRSWGVRDSIPTTEAEVPTPTGTQGARLFDEEGILTAVAKYKPELLPQFSRAGLRLYLHGLVGIRYQAVETAPVKSHSVITDKGIVDTAERLEALPESHLKALLMDCLVDEIELSRGNSGQAAPKKQYTIAKVRARELGYTAEQVGNGSQLGKFLKKQIEPAFSDRVGKFPVWHYEVNDRLDTAIHEFMSLRGYLMAG